MIDLIFTLTTTEGTEVMTVSPDGYDDSTITFERGEKYWGAFRKWAMPVKFIKSYATKIRYEFYTKGMRGLCEIKIEKLNRVTLQYRTVYTGQGDFMTFRDYDDYCEIAFKDSGLANYIKECSTNEYQINHVDIPTVSFQYSESNYDAVNIYDLFVALADKMTDGKFTDETYIFKSDLVGNIGCNISGYDGDDRRYIITNGTNLINPGVSVTKGNYYELSFDTLFKMLSVFNDCAIGIEIDELTGKEVLRIENKTHFFNSTDPIIDLGKVSAFSANVDKSLSAGKLKIGWPGGKDEKNIAIYETNCISVWQLPNMNNEKTLELTSSIRADGVEIVRVINEADENSETEIYLLEVKPDELGVSFTFENDSTGIITTDTPPTPFSLYNGTLTPRNCLRKYVGFISSLNWNYSGIAAKYISGENRLIDTAVKRYDEGYAYLESADVPLTYPAYFYPIIFEVEVEIENNVLDLLNDNPHRLISFEYRNNTYQGWLKDVTLNIYKNTKAKLKLIANVGFDNIIYNLIR